MDDSYPSLASSSRPFPVPTIPEDTLHYTLHLPPGEDPTSLAVLITEYVYSLLTQPWLWNKDTWELRTVSDSSKLEGRMRVGDSVDDEWCVVWLLREVSKKWPEIIMSIRDTDGEFLLIEAANELPAWVSPDNATNRLWLKDGQLHLIPLDVQSRLPDGRVRDDADDEATLTDTDGLKAVRTGKCRAEAVEQAVWNRIQGYPAALRTHIHRTNVYLPIGVAKALSIQPDLIQKAVEAFYVRDPAQLRATSRMTHFPPSPSLLSSVLMTRPAYAQLQGQVFHPPRVFGLEWHVGDGVDLDDERRWRDLGVKISTGFEIMFREGGKRSAKQSVTKVGYEEFVQNLRRAGFFGNELEGSQKWKEREAVAQKGWNDTRSGETASRGPSFASQVDEAIRLSQEPSASTLPEDSDSWLEISPTELDGMMARSSGTVLSEKPEPAGEDGKALGDLAQKVQEFVGGQGSMQGAMFMDELSDEEEDSDNEDIDKDQRMKDLVAPLPAEEWGRKADTKPSKPALKQKKPVDNVRLAMRPPVFEKQHYDGVETDSDDSDDELAPAGTLGRLAAELKVKDAAGFEDVEKELAKNRKRGLGDNIDEEMRQRVWGEEEAPQIIELDDDRDEEGDVDMGGQEEEFLKFTREALGITDDQWDSILSSRRDRGAFVPQSSPKASTSARPAEQPKASQDPPNEPKTADASPLDSFEKVMAAMDAQLAAAKAPKPSLKDPKALPSEADLDDMSEADLEAMDRELKAALHGANDDEMDEDDPDEAAELGEEEKREYRMMKDFLESYRAQNGQSGVIGNLFGRLGET